MVSKKAKDFLDEEKTIYNYLRKTNRIIARLLKLNTTKRQQLYLLSSLIDRYEDLQREGTWKKIRDKEFRKKKRERLEKRMRDAKAQYLRAQKNQLKLLGRETNIGDREKVLVEDLEKEIPLFEGLTPEEREVISDLVAREDFSIKQVFKHITIIHQGIRDQEAAMNKVDPIGKKGNELKEIRAVVANFDSLVYREKDALDSWGKLNVRMMDISREITDEYVRVKKREKDLKSKLNEDDLKMAMEAIGDEVTNERNKYQKLTKFLHDQRTLRKEMNPNQMAAVHITDHFPNQGIMKTTAQVTETTIEGVKVFFPRETIHFSINGPVGSHMYGSWDGKLYAIIIPLDKIIDRIVNISPQDAFVVGQLELPEGTEILIPKPRMFDVERVKLNLQRKAGKAVIVVYGREETSHGAAVRRLRERGYVPMRIGMWSWNGPVSEEDAERLRDFWYEMSLDWTSKFRELADRLDKEIGAHSNTFWDHLEKTANRANYTILASVRGETGSVGDVAGSKRELIGVRKELQEKAKKLKSKEEKEAIDRTIKAIRYIYDALSNISF